MRPSCDLSRPSRTRTPGVTNLRAAGAMARGQPASAAEMQKGGAWHRSVAGQCLVRDNRLAMFAATRNSCGTESGFELPSARPRFSAAASQALQQALAARPRFSKRRSSRRAASALPRARCGKKTARLRGEHALAARRSKRAASCEARRDERGRACEAARGNGNWRACIAPLACPAPQTAEMAPSALLRKFLILQQHIRKRPCAM